MSETIVVIAAHAFEARAAAGVGSAMTKEPWGQWTLYRGEMWDRPMAVIRCGPGKVAAAAAAQASIQYLDPAVLVSFGTAGCPDPRVKLGTLMVSVRVVDVALTLLEELPVKIPNQFTPDEGLTDRLLAVPGTTPATVLCWEGRVVTPLSQLPTGLGGGPVAVDWESAAVAQVAQMWNVPWTVCKTISDHGEADRLRLLALAARRPLQWGAEAIRRACDAYLKERTQAPEVTA